MGNRTAKTDNVTGSESYAFDDANRIATRQVGSSAVQSYTSDANGNTLTDASHTNKWDSQNRLVSSLSNGKTSDFRYGADGLWRRFSVTPTGQSQPTMITHYGYDGTNVIREWEENIAGVLNVSATYLLGPSGPMYKRPANAIDVRWYVYDGLGSVVGEVDVSGAMLVEKKHDVFGLRRGTVGTENSRHGFVGSLGHYSDDETGLVYMRARYYDPAIGRFISQDPALDGENWFAYCQNNPVCYVDESGTEIGIPDLADLSELLGKWFAFSTPKWLHGLFSFIEKMGLCKAMIMAGIVFAVSGVRIAGLAAMAVVVPGLGVTLGLVAGIMVTIGVMLICIGFALAMAEAVDAGATVSQHGWEGYDDGKSVLTGN